MTRVLVLNTGSSSVKWTVLAADKTVLAGGSEPWSAEDSAARADQLRAALKRPEGGASSTWRSKRELRDRPQ